MRNIIYVVLVGIAVTAVFNLGMGRLVGDEMQFSTAPMFWIDGEVLSIDQSGGSRNKEAVVKLASGDSVRASIPEACVIFPGQTVNISKSSEGLFGETRYKVMGVKESRLPRT